MNRKRAISLSLSYEPRGLKEKSLREQMCESYLIRTAVNVSKYEFIAGLWNLKAPRIRISV